MSFDDIEKDMYDIKFIKSLAERTDRFISAEDYKQSQIYEDLINGKPDVCKDRILSIIEDLEDEVKRKENDMIDSYYEDDGADPPVYTIAALMNLDKTLNEGNNLLKDFEKVFNLTNLHLSNLDNCESALTCAAEMFHVSIIWR